MQMNQETSGELWACQEGASGILRDAQLQLLQQLIGTQTLLGTPGWGR